MAGNPQRRPIRTTSAVWWTPSCAPCVPDRYPPPGGADSPSEIPSAMRDTQEAVCLAARGVEAHDISLRIDPANLGTGCARIIDGRELSAAEQKSVNFL